MSPPIRSFSIAQNWPCHCVMKTLPGSLPWFLIALILYYSYQSVSLSFPNPHYELPESRFYPAHLWCLGSDWVGQIQFCDSLPFTALGPSAGPRVQEVRFYHVGGKWIWGPDSILLWQWDFLTVTASLPRIEESKAFFPEKETLISHYLFENRKGINSSGEMSPQRLLQPNYFPRGM